MISYKIMSINIILFCYRDRNKYMAGRSLIMSAIDYRKEVIMIWCKPSLKTFSYFWQHMDEYRGQEDASAEAHEPGHEVLHPLHPLRLQQPDQQQGGQSAAQLDEAKEDEDDDFCSDEIHPPNCVHFSPSMMGNRHF